MGDETNEMRTATPVSFGACDIGFGNGNFYYKGIVRSINECALRALEDRELNNAYINAVVTTETKIIESSETAYFDCYVKATKRPSHSEIRKVHYIIIVTF